MLLKIPKDYQRTEDVLQYQITFVGVSYPPGQFHNKISLQQGKIASSDSMIHFF